MNRQAKINFKWAKDDAFRFPTIAHLKIFKVISQDKHQMGEGQCLQISLNCSLWPVALSEWAFKVYIKGGFF